MYPNIYLDITDSKSPVPLSSSDTTRTIKIYSRIYATNLFFLVPYPLLTSSQLLVYNLVNKETKSKKILSCLNNWLSPEQLCIPDPDRKY